MFTSVTKEESLLRIFVLIIVIWLSGCALPPTEQFLKYDQAFDQTHKASRSVLKVYNVYEKQLYPLDPNVFMPKQAALISDTAPGPLTALYSRGFDIVDQYNLILFRYAHGDSVSILNDEIENLNASVSHLGAVLKLTSDAAQLSRTVSIAQKVAQISLISLDKVEFEISLAKGGDHVRAFLLIVREDTRDMYQDVSTSMLQRIKLNTSNLTQEKLNRQKFRKMLASWVLLIDETITELDSLEAAIAAGSRSRFTLGNVSNSLDRHFQAPRSPFD